jgi:hypothetical protein
VEKQWIEHWAFESYTSDEDANSTRYHCATSPTDVSHQMHEICHLICLYFFTLSMIIRACMDSAPAASTDSPGLANLIELSIFRPYHQTSRHS